jgi:hypothetical protein
MALNERVMQLNKCCIGRWLVSFYTQPNKLTEVDVSFERDRPLAWLSSLSSAIELNAARGRRVDSSIRCSHPAKGLFMKLLLSALVLGVLTSLAGTDAFGQYVKPQPSARDISHKVTLRCSPRKLWLGDTLTLNISVPHGRDLAILSPDDKFFWLRSWEPNDQATTAQWYAFEKVQW